MIDLFDEGLWEKAWKEDPHSFANKMKKAGIDATHSFDHKAKAFNEQVFNEEGRLRTKRIMNWLEGQGVQYKDASILDIGAASGGFSIPFAERGASVTSVEPCLPLAELLEENAAKLKHGAIDIVTQPFEHIDLQGMGWENKFDLVFVSMCPVVSDWESVLRVLSCAKQYCYISMSAGSHVSSLVDEVWPLVASQSLKPQHMEMGYLLHLLYIKGYAFQSLVTREMKTTESSRVEVLNELMIRLKMNGLVDDERTRGIVAEYLEQKYPDDRVIFQEGGRYGKVLVQLQDQNMYTRELQQA
ncbi:Methyltransferase type 11 [Paenibacillus curdlanolyticus YK9]|uniref:Methyltransferase type 11 n=1 Tax=Paenibacillus curdlanolyticus YK9 TaxID=717606 RepID=E0I594_9BACL|nr:class I SAM-dependent methyltransferase [Paenibacillus curdlanolyticus]EFM12136.1 Methyltransferase type 11 [Paenibacillus curdlanolyticus YK9]